MRPLYFSATKSSNHIQISRGSPSVQEGASQRHAETSLYSGVVYFGGVGDGAISASSATSMVMDEKAWGVVSLQSGGSGNDEYTVSVGSSCLIADAYKSSGDSLRIDDYSENITEFFSVEGRHLFISTTWGTNVLIVDALNSRGAMETIIFSDITLAGSADSSSRLLKSYQTRGDQSFDQLISRGDFDPRAMGMQAAEDVRDAVQSLYSYNIANAFALDRTGGALMNTELPKGAQDYQFYNFGAARYGIQDKTKSTIDEITGLPALSFSGSCISVVSEIKGVFDQLTGEDTQDAQIYRLYNAAFARFPDAGGLRFWIKQYVNGSEYRNIAKSFINSSEFKSRYGMDNSNEDYAVNMYKNVLGRLPDAAGLSYWVNTLETGTNSRENVLGYFAESFENKTLFSQVTGFV